MRRAHLLAALAILILAGGLAGCGGLGEGASQSLVPEDERERAPALDAPALDGGARVTLAQHAGRPVVLNFWASWCAPCQKETPELVAFAKSHPGVDVVGIAVTDKPSDSRSFAAKKGVTYPIGVDRDGGTAADFGVTGLPVTVLVDPQGRVADTIFGPVTGAELEGLTSRL
jgi:thiol-disulfide isomerase/thioredoxin